MSPAERQQRLQFIDLTNSDIALLRDLAGSIEPQLSAVVDALYDHLLQFGETAQLLHDRTTIDRLKKLQLDYLIRIFQEIGRAHV